MSKMEKYDTMTKSQIAESVIAQWVKLNGRIHGNRKDTERELMALDVESLVWLAENMI